MSQLLYYLLIKPLSLLSLWMLYRISDLMFLFIYYLIPYRKKLVFKNLNKSFPEKSDKEIQQIARKFYRHFCDIIVESIKLFSISEKEIRTRCTTDSDSLEIFDQLSTENKSVIILGGHHNNWEMAALGFNSLIPHQTIGIYAPLKNIFFDKKLKESRGRFGLGLVSVKDVQEAFEQHVGHQIAMIFATDQSPSRNAKKVYWTNFLNQDTAVLFGAEKYARQYNLPVVFTTIWRIRRGYYSYTLEMLEASPADTAHGEITQKHTAKLEENIRQQPESWLWSHNRWKLKRE